MGGVQASWERVRGRGRGIGVGGRGLLPHTGTWGCLVAPCNLARQNP